MWRNLLAANKCLVLPTASFHGIYYCKSCINQGIFDDNAEAAQHCPPNSKFVT